MLILIDSCQLFLLYPYVYHYGYVYATSTSSSTFCSPETSGYASGAGSQILTCLGLMLLSEGLYEYDCERELNDDVAGQVPRGVGAVLETGKRFAIENLLRVAIDDLDGLGAGGGIPVEQVERDAVRAVP